MFDDFTVQIQIDEYEISEDELLFLLGSLFF